MAKRRGPSHSLPLTAYKLEWEKLVAADQQRFCELNLPDLAAKFFSDSCQATKAQAKRKVRAQASTPVALDFAADRQSSRSTAIQKVRQVKGD